MSIIGLMNYNVSRTETGKSQLASIQSAYLKSITNQNITLEQLDQIEAWLVTSPSMMDQPEMYVGLEKVKAEFQLLKESILLREKNEHYMLGQ